jgi:hypothetical protein
MRRLHRWRNFKLALLRSRSDGDGLGSVHASENSGTFGHSLLQPLKHGSSMVATNRVHKAIAAATVADNAEVKSP